MKEKIDVLIKANEARIKTYWQDAANYYQFYLTNFGDDVEVIKTLALTYLAFSFDETGIHATQALYWINKAIALDPKRSEFYVIQGEIFYLALDVPDYVKAANSFKTALEITPNCVNALLGLSNLVNVPEQVVSIADAVKFLEYATTLSPEDSRIFTRLGTLYLQAGHLTQAGDSYKRALLCPIPIKNTDEITDQLILYSD